MNKQNAVCARGLRDATFDFALPQGWVDDVYRLTGIYPAPYFVWLYEKGSYSGCACPICEAGKELLANYAQRLTERDRKNTAR